MNLVPIDSTRPSGLEALKSTIPESFTTLWLYVPLLSYILQLQQSHFFRSATNSKKLHTENIADEVCIGDAACEMSGTAECNATTAQQSQSQSIAALPDEVLIGIFALLDCKSLLKTVNR